ncbi:alpha-galactosidase [Streptomyces sp. L7]
MWSDAGFGGASRTWHAYQRTYVIPDADRDRPVLYNSWEATQFDISEEQQEVLAQRAAAAGVELFVVDDGWFGARTSDRAGLGDWTPNPDRFPAGLKPLADRVHSLGMQFGIWVEPEMINPDSDLYRAHPDWVQYQEGTKADGVPQSARASTSPARTSRKYLWEQLDGLLSSAPIDYVKWDFNRCFTDAGWPGDAYPQRLWIDHVRALYALLDRLREAHPGVAFESCSGGGGRIDLGDPSAVRTRCGPPTTPTRSTGSPSSTASRQIHPARMMAAWVTDGPNTQLNDRVSSLRFRFVSAMAGVLGVGGDLSEWTAEELAEAREWIALCKEIRPLVQHGDLHRLRPPTGGLSAVQQTRRRERRPRPAPGAALRRAGTGARLRGLDPTASYECLGNG